MKIIIGADIVPTLTNEEYFNRADIQNLLGDALIHVLEDGDFRIFNLEAPFIQKKTPIKKCGPALGAPIEAVDAMKAMGIDLFTLANNHIMDHGVEGLNSTINVLNESKIDYVGAGNSLVEACHGYIKEVSGKRIGVYACCEHEFSIAENEVPGANPFDPLESLDHISSLKQLCDYVIVLYHGGKECYRYPSPLLQKTCRKMVDKGADVVVTQHSHCIGCKEEYRGGTIVYGQGNFLFDGNSNEYWNTGLLLQISDGFQITYIPIVKKGECVRLASGEEAKEILAQFEIRSVEIENPLSVDEKYSVFASSMIDRYYTAFLGRSSIIFRIVNKILHNKLRKWIFNKRYTQNAILEIRNYIECEAHRELLIKGLKLKNRIK